MFRKNKKKKSLGYIIVRMTLSTLTKEEYNEVKFHPVLNIIVRLDGRFGLRANFFVNMLCLNLEVLFVQL